MTEAVHPKPLLFRNYLIVDGPARVGKLFAAALIANLDRVDWAYHSPVIENIGQLWRAGALDAASAAGFLRLCIDSTLYDPIVGRHLNARPGDRLSVRKSLSHDDIAARSLAPDGNAAVARFNDEDRIPCLVCHDVLPHQPVFYAAVPQLRIVFVTRHPIDAAHSWFAQGWGERHGVDPRSFSPTFAAGGAPAPWWALDWRDQYAAAGPADRVVRGFLHVDSLYASNAAAAERAHLGQVLEVAYERMVETPERELAAIARFLATTVPPNIAIAMARESVPGRVDVAARAKKLDEMRHAASPALIAELLERGRAYEARWRTEETVD
jgi:hypothetical protein